jgi:hypothetical protein
VRVDISGSPRIPVQPGNAFLGTDSLDPISVTRSLTFTNVARNWMQEKKLKRTEQFTLRKKFEKRQMTRRKYVFSQSTPDEHQTNYFTFDRR